MERLDILFRSIIAFAVLLLSTRLMGRKQLSQITFFDYIVGITIGSIAASMAVDESIPLADGVIALVVWCALPIIIGTLALNNLKFRTLIDGVPKILIQNGVILNENLKKEKYNIGDLLMQLRDKEIFDISEVEFAVLEPNGTLSVLKKSESQCPTKKDLNISSEQAELMTELIIDGEILQEHLKSIGKDKDWLLKELSKINVTDIKNIVFAGLLPDGKIYVSERNKMKGEKGLL